ncbi:MAG: glycosyltransferase [Clostridia bacterium]|nr:glycosyltransferase [Clostridia bacterium]
MNLEVLLATMDQTDDSVLDFMGVNSDIIVCNQNSEKTDYRSYERKGYNVRWYDFQERGVGLNRNNALLRSTADICLLADDDVKYEDGYEKIILEAFEKNPKADVILFNIYSADGKKRSEAEKNIRVRLRNCGKYGGVRIAFRRMSVIKNAISFNQLFGGGCMFTAGEDVIFVKTCIEKGLHVIAVPDCILRLTDKRPSTWFNGHNPKFYEDFGSSYYCHFGNLAVVATFLQLIRKRKIWVNDYPFWKAWKHARDGIKKYKNLK